MTDKCIYLGLGEVNYGQYIDTGGILHTVVIDRLFKEKEGEK